MAVSKQWTALEIILSTIENRGYEHNRKEKTMIKVIIERQVKKGEDIALLLLEFRAAAMRYPGYVTGETLLSTEDSFNLVTISTWETLEDWKAWETSETRAKLYQQAEPILVGKPKVKTYGIMSTEKRA